MATIKFKKETEGFSIQKDSQPKESFVGCAVQISCDSDSFVVMINNVPYYYEKSKHTFLINDVDVTGNTTVQISDSIRDDVTNSGSGGSGMVLEEYQNSAMSAAVMAYVYRDEDDNIVRVYEPARNNDIRLGGYDDIFPFDNANCYNNTFNKVSLENLASDIVLQDNEFSRIKINANSHTGLIIKKNIWNGSNGGVGTPNDADLYISGNGVSLLENTIAAGQEGSNSTYLDSLGAGSAIQSCNFLGSNDCDFHGRQASIDRCTIDVYGGFQVNAGIGGSANMTQTYIGNSGYVDLYTSKQVSGCYLNGFAFLTANNNISNCQVGQSGGIDANGFTVSSSSVAAHVTFIANEATSNKVIDAVKKYRAYITQSGTDAPIVINEFENTLGGTPVFGYGGVGYYTVALTGAFPSGKTDVRISYDLGASVGGLVAGAGRLDNDTVQLFNYLGDYSNVNSFAGSIEILVNP
jgi:hypothetical protein